MSIKDDYLRQYIQGMAAQQTQNQMSNLSQMGNLSNIYNNDSLKNYINPTIEELYAQVEIIQKEIDHRELHTPKQGPTGLELKTHEALKNAWDAYREIRTLLGLK